MFISTRLNERFIILFSYSLVSGTLGALAMLGISVLSGQNLSLPLTIPYVGSLLYLAAFGSIAAFGLHLTLPGRIGSAKSAYVAMLIPVVALVFSTLFEKFQWSTSTFAGVVFILTGNSIFMKSKSKMVVDKGALKN